MEGEAALKWVRGVCLITMAELLFLTLGSFLGWAVVDEVEAAEVGPAKFALAFFDVLAAEVDSAAVALVFFVILAAEAGLFLTIIGSASFFFFLRC